MPRRYLIVGQGAAGIAAAEEIRTQDPAGDILLVSQDPHGYYSRPGLAYYLTGELPDRALFPWDEKDFARLRLRRRQGRVVRLHPQAHLVELDDGSRLPYDRLLLAVGSLAFRPPLPGIELEGVVTLDSLDDARQIVKRSRRARAAVVVGGGITALELVEGLRARRVRVHYLLRGDRYWRSVLDETESRIVEKRLEKEGVRIHRRTEIAEILGKRGRVVGVLTKDGQQIKCNLVAVAIGVRPRLELAKNAGLETDRGIVVNERLQTGVADIFAAGDAAQVRDPRSGKALLDTLWSVAVAQGRVAGRNMAGQTAVYRKGVPFNVTRLAGLTTTIIGAVGRGVDRDLLGIARGDSEAWRQLPGAPDAAGVELLAAQEGFDVNHLRVLVGRQTLIGAVVMGDQTLSRPLHHLIAHEVDISSIRDQLLHPAAASSLGDLILRFWLDWRRDAAP